MLRTAVQLARPHSWVKNIFVLLPIIFAGRVDDPHAWVLILVAAVAFCAASSTAYVFNDVKDRDRDKLHPTKRMRPLPLGQISVRAAVAEGALLGLGALGIGLFVNVATALVLVAYLVLQFAYSYYLKRIMLLDVICIALGFVLRTVAGATAIGVVVSPWLLICTFTLCLFMGFCKRGNEIASLGDGQLGENHRRTLREYRPELLVHLITLSAGLAVVGFISYATNPVTVERFGTQHLVYTLPLVVYAIFRFAMLSLAGTYSDPTEIVLRDHPFQLAVALWGAATLAIITWGL